MTNRHNNKIVSRWYRRWHAVIRQALASRLYRTEDVEDLAQEVYLRMLRVPSPDLVRHPQSYLYRMAVNVAEEWRLRAQQALEHDSDALEILEAEGGPEDDAVQRQRDDAVRHSLAELPQTARMALVLHTHEGMTYEQIAVRMGVSRRAVKRYVANGYAALREQLTDFREQDGSRTEQKHVEK